ncbi:MAG: TonB-dependent receptor [Bacteroides sp.]|nr:TonB-dependent receptor [Bacteroides sp.]
MFPSGAIAWRLSEEEFMKADWLDNLKIRASYGVSGNNNIPSGQTEKVFSVADQKKWLNITDTWWTAGKTLDNARLKWESTYSANIGLILPCLTVVSTGRWISIRILPKIC